MGLSQRNIWTIQAAAILFAALLSVGCQSSSVSTARLVASQSRLDFNGLDSTAFLRPVSVTGAAPRAWTPLPLEINALYTHEQWRSPTGSTGVGIVFVNFPLPLAPTAVLWLAEQHFESMPGENGRLLGEWADPLGRWWFTAQNSRLHVCGYVITEGASAWIVYYGYRADVELQQVEMSIAARSVQSVVPLTHVREPAGPNVAEAPRLRRDSPSTGATE